MNPVHTITDLSALRALTDPLRKEILRLLQREPRTASQLAAALGEKPTKLHYHVTELERNGLIELAETRMKGNLQEKYYRAVAELYRVDPRLFADGPEARSAFYDHATVTLDHAGLDLREAIGAGRVTAAESGRALTSLLRLHLPPEAVEELRSRLDALLSEFRGKSRPDLPDAAALTLLFYPLAPPSDTPPHSGEGGGPTPDGRDETAS